MNLNLRQLTQFARDLVGRSDQAVDEELRRRHLDAETRVAVKREILAAAAQPRQPRRVGYRMAIVATGEMAPDRAEYRPGQAPPAEPGSDIVDRDLFGRCGFKAGRKYGRRQVDARLKERYPDDEPDAVTKRLAAKVRLHELGMVHDDDADDAAGWQDPRSQMPGGTPPTGTDRLHASADVLRDRQGRPIVLRSRP